MGNAVLFNSVQSPSLDELSGNIEDVIRATTKDIRDAICSVDEAWVKGRLATLQKNPGTFIGDIEGLNLDGNDVLVSDWSNLGAETEFRIPGVPVDRRKPDYVRKVYSADNGYVVILPEKDCGAGAGPLWELLVGLDQKTMDELKRELDRWTFRLLC